MRLPHRPDGHRLVSWLVVGALVAGVTWAVARQDGYAVAEPELHDAGVWVTRADQLRVGRVNTEIAAVDTSLAVAGSGFEVLQDGAEVVLRQTDPSMLVRVDPSTAELVPGPEVPADAEVTLGGGTAAVWDRGTGHLHVLPVADLLGLDLTGDEPTAEVPGAATVVAGTDGTVHLLELGTGAVTSYDGSGTPVAEHTLDVPGDGLGRAALSAVGATPVALDLATGDLLLPDRAPVPLGATDTPPALQQPSGPADGVLVALPDRLVEVALAPPAPDAGPDVADVVDNGGGLPSAPVRVGGCDYAAWGGNGLVARRCDGDVRTRTFDQLGGGRELQWRSNRGRAVLNELQTGQQLLWGDAEPVFVDSWAEAFSDEPEETADTEESVEVEQQQQTFDRTKNDPPVARDDDVGTRDGRPVLVRPLRNDTDPDGDVLVLSPLDAIDPDVGRVTVVDGGRGVLVEPATSSGGTITIPYEITDGHGHADSARISVRLADGNSPPQPAAEQRTTVVTGGTVLHDVVVPALDPEGDPVSVVDATTDAGQVTWESSGQLSFTATNTPGEVEVTYVLADDRGAEGSGRLLVEVVPREVNEPPVARSDHAATRVGREVVVDLLANDTDANGDELSLVRVESLTGGSVRWEPTSPEVRFSSDVPGPEVFLYRITDGEDTDEGLLRIDVEALDDAHPPVAVRDDVLLRPGTPAFVPVLDNDVDRDGDVLVVTGVDLPADSPLDVQVINRTLLRIEADAALDGATELDYTITDGGAEDRGRVVVAPEPVRDRNQPPVVGPDEFTVRAGAVTTLDVLRNDEDPDGDRLELVEPDEVDDQTAARDGRLFLRDGELRYQAPTAARSSVVLRSTVVDTAENVASGQLVIQVLPADGEVNNPPVAPTLTARVLAGGSVTVPVPVGTMDPEGDAVVLLGPVTAPSRGSVTEVGPDELTYRADDGSGGTDQFRYRVRDQFGLEATGTVLVGIARAATSNNDPVASDDEVNVPPGATVTVPVLDNDTDPDGDPISIASEADDVLTVARGELELVAGEVVYTAPADAEIDQRTSFRYVVTDGRGGRDTGTVQVVFSDDGVNRPPVPVDDLVEPQEPGTTFRTAPLQGNDTDPDGDTLEVVSVSLDDAVVGPDGSVRLTMPEAPLQFTYLVSDGLEQRRAAVTVPLAGGRPPVAGLDRGEVVAGESVIVDVLDNDRDPDGDEVVLLDVVGARHGTAEVVDGQVRYTATDTSHVGDAGFAYLVGDDPDPAAALTTIGFARIEVLPPPEPPSPEDPDDPEAPDPLPPVFTSLDVELPAGASRTLDVGAAVTDPDSDELTFGEVTGAGEGVGAELVGTRLTVTADVDAAPGTVLDLAVPVSDGTTTVDGRVRVTVVGADAPLPVAVADEATTIQGRAVTVPVLDNDVDPVGQGLTVTSVDGPDGVAVTTDGTGVTVTPDPDRRDIGQVTITYAVADATGDPTRAATGTLLVTVVGRPDVPAAPSCIGGESTRVQIGWAAPSANGARITEYVVRIREFSGSGATPTSTETRTYPGGATVQTVDGLTNGAAHTFEVAAVNEAVVGEPEFSDPSPRCVPDQVPDRPAAPSTEFGDEELLVTFEAPTSDGSPVRELTLRNTTTGEAVTLGPTQTQHRWTGLENGTSYRFTLTATNDLGASDPSPQSDGDGIPAGVPQDLVAPTTERGDRFLTVRWQEPRPNGDAIDRYRVQVERDGTVERTISVDDASRRSLRVDTDNGVPYRFRFAAHNKAGWSTWSAWSIENSSAGRPTAPGTPSATDGDRQSVLVYATSDDNGAALDRYEVSINGGSWQTLTDNPLNSSAQSSTVRNLTNGTDYAFRIRAVNSVGAGPASGTSPTVRPYGRTNPVRNLTALRDARDHVLEWTWNAPSLNGRAIDRYEVDFGFSGNWESVGLATSHSREVLDHEGHSLRVRAVARDADNARRTSDDDGEINYAFIDYKSITPHDRAGSQTPQDDPRCSSSHCEWVAFTLENLFPGSTYSFDLRNVGRVTITTNGTPGTQGRVSFTRNNKDYLANGATSCMAMLAMTHNGRIASPENSPCFGGFEP